MEQPRRTCALWCPDWPVVAARRLDPALGDTPVVVVDRGARGKVVVSVSSEARAEGVAVGLRVREAEARCAGLVVLDADEAADARAFELVVRAVEELVPRLVLERPGQLSFPTRGPSRYFGGDDALAARIVACVRALDVTDVRAGIAEGAFAAGLAARATEERALGAVVVPAGETPAFLARWPVTVLAGSVDAAFGPGRSGGSTDGNALVDLLARLGLRTLGAFAELPPAAVLARFGPPGVLAHRLARGEVEHEPVATVPPAELLEAIELDPPATRVDEAAFAAKMLADRLLAHLDALGLCCARVVVEAETEHGEHFSRTWRHEGALTPAALVARVRWQLDSWLLTDTVTSPITGGISRLVLAPDDLGPAVGRQLGFWGGDPAAADRAGRALARVQGMLGPDAVVTALDGGGRTPTERIRWVPWGEPRPEPGRQPESARSPWPGAVPGPAPARVFDPPVPAELVDVAGAPVAVSGRGEPSAPPAGLRCAVLPDGGGPLVAWSGPWAHDLRWWDAHRRRALWQVVVGGGPPGSGVACLVVLERGRTAVEAVYD
ncbi:MAG TPA: DNA polymerase Y family protein [Acidimicrobiia bacterium]|nr:DNA polymerase Y family protein [Acidimicrobiia bacterium]